MSASQRPSAAARLYRRLLVFFPADFRREYADEAARVFDELRADARALASPRLPPCGAARCSPPHVMGWRSGWTTGEAPLSTSTTRPGGLTLWTSSDRT